MKTSLTFKTQQRAELLRFALRGRISGKIPIWIRHLYEKNIEQKYPAKNKLPEIWGLYLCFQFRPISIQDDVMNLTCENK